MFNPALPATGSPDSSAEMRAQLSGLKALIDAVPAGPQGPQGVPGPQGPPFADAVVDAVNTLNPGDSATAGTSFDGSSVHFTFGIPRGADGMNGTNGADGPPGPAGPPGEVNDTQLADAIAGTSSNSNAVATLDTPFANNPPTLADIELLRAKINELIAALRR